MTGERLIPVDEMALLFGVPLEEASAWIERGLVPNAAGPAGEPCVTPGSLKEFLLRLLGESLDRRESSVDYRARRFALTTLCALERDFPAARGTPAGTRHVLVVEDEDQVADLLGRILSTFGDRVVVHRAADGFEACAALFRYPVDLALVDIVMPSFDGFALCSLIRSVVPLAGVKLLVVSGFMGENVRSALERIGVTEFLDKPFSPRELQGRITAFLGIAPSAPPRRRELAPGDASLRKGDGGLSD